MPARDDASSVLDSFLEPTNGHRCLALASGLAAFDSRRWLIRHCRKRIWISTFLWRNDRVGNFLVDELARRASEGIEIRILLDHWPETSSADSIVHRFRELVDANQLEVRMFNPIVEKLPLDESEVALAGLFDGAKFNHRMHGKLVLFDESSAIVGGRNVGDEYFDLHRFRCFSDKELLIQGPAVEELGESFDAFWNSPLTIDLAQFHIGSRPDQPLDPRASHPEEWQMFLEIVDQCCPNYTAELFEPDSVQVITDDPSVDQNAPTATADATIDFFTRATRSLRVTSPILILQKDWLKSLRKLRREQPELEFSLVTNSLLSSDNLYTYVAGLHQRRQLLGDLETRLHEIRAIPRDVNEIVPSYPQLTEENAKLDEQPASGFGSNQFECRELHTTLHEKFAVVDDQWLLLGSPNLDPRSLVCNTEILLVIRGREIAEYFTSIHNRFRLNRNSWVVAETSTWRRPAWWTRLQVAWYRLTGRGRSPYRESRCFEPREETPDSIPDPDAQDFAEQYRCCGIYPGVDDSETRIELVLLESLSTIFRRLL